MAKALRTVVVDAAKMAGLYAFCMVVWSKPKCCILSSQQSVDMGRRQCFSSADTGQAKVS